ncbi:MAG: hypothetical protein AB7O59_13580 [Pirellulales bacterium]
MWVHAVDRPELAPLQMPARFNHDVAYFMTPPGERGAPRLPAGEFWINLDEARRWLDEGVLLLVSPLDSENQAEVELSEEQEAWLEWLVAHGVQHIRLTPT